MNLKRNILVGILCTAVLSASIIVSCRKENSNSSGSIPAGQQKVLVSLNDDPDPNVTSVVVDIQYVEVKVDTGNFHHEDDYYDEDHEEDHQHQGDEGNHHGDHFGKWDTLSVKPGLYDLLKLKNGMDTLIASGFSHIGKITKLRITLGSNNSITIDSTHHYPLPICDGIPYVYANIRSHSLDSLGGGQYLIRLDFNVEKSIEFEDGQYCLQPKLKSYSQKTSGIIAGTVLPAEAHAHVKVYNSTDTAFAIPEREGEFEVRGLKEGTYSVLFKAVLPFKDTTLMNVQVKKGNETELPVITLHQ